MTKNVEWNGITPDESQEFEICIQGPSYPDTPNCKKIDYQGGDLTWPNLIPGDYTVTESALGSSWKTPVIDDSVAAVPINGGQGTATVDNERELGSLKVTKNVEWNGITPDESQEFEICIQGPSYPDTPNCKKIDYQGGDLTWPNLIPGDYTVTESALGSSWKTPVIDDSVAAVPINGGQGTATVDNERELGSLKVTKNVEWNGITPDESQEFEICIQGPSYPDTPNCKKIDYQGGDLTWPNLIPGGYTVDGVGARAVRGRRRSLTTPLPRSRSMVVRARRRSTTSASWVR